MKFVNVMCMLTIQLPLEKKKQSNGVILAFMTNTLLQVMACFLLYTFSNVKQTIPNIIHHIFLYGYHPRSMAYMQDIHSLSISLVNLRTLHFSVGINRCIPYSFKLFLYTKYAYLPFGLISP